MQDTEEVAVALQNSSNGTIKVSFEFTNREHRVLVADSHRPACIMQVSTTRTRSGFIPAGDRARLSELPSVQLSLGTRERAQCVAVYARR
jgi:hypothetical protein